MNQADPPPGAGGTAICVRDEKRDFTGPSESVLHNTLQRFYQMFAAMYSGVLLMTEEGRVEFVNQAFCDAYGLPEAPCLSPFGFPPINYPTT
jgi:PAS domain-containing protein